MKKSILYVAIIAILAISAWWLIKEKKQNSSIIALEEQYAFGIPDTAAITRVIISDKTPASIELTRQNSGWQVNGKFKARADAIDVLLETMHRQSMRTFVPEATQPTILKRLAVYGKEVKVYSGDKLIKHFFVGTETPDQLGTYMMLAGAEQPFAVHIQGFNGYLNSRFFTEEYLWRDRTIFGVAKENIASIKMTYTSSEAESFTVDNTGAKPVLKGLDGTVVGDVQEVNMNIFLGSFRTANYEAMVVPSDGIWAKKDSLQNALPVFELVVTDNTGTTQKLTGYRKRPDRDEEVGEDGLPLEWDPDRLYAFLDDGRMVLIQYYGLRNLIVTKEFFGLELNLDNWFLIILSQAHL